VGHGRPPSTPTLRPRPRDVRARIHGDHRQGPYRLEHYTRAWFDPWLREDASPLGRLMAPSVDGIDRGDFLSQKWHSGVCVPEAQVDCADLLSC